MFSSFVRSVLVVGVLIFFVILALRHFNDQFSRPEPIRIKCYRVEDARLYVAVVDTIHVVGHAR